MQAVVRRGKEICEMVLLTTLRSISNCRSFADSHSSLAPSALPGSASLDIVPHGESHSLSPSWPPSEPPIVGMGVVSVPTVKVPKASGLGGGDGSGDVAEDGIGEWDVSPSSSLDGEGVYISSFGAGGEEGDE